MKRAEFRKSLEGRIYAALEWYVGCHMTDETMRNIDADLRSVLEDEIKRFRVAPPKWKLKAWRGENRTVIIRVVKDSDN